MIALMFAGLLTAAPMQEMPQAAAPSDPGVVGLCIRWEPRNLNRVAEARVVVSSGNRQLDNNVRRWAGKQDWPIEDNASHGQWMGVYLASGGAVAPAGALPDCSALPDHSWPAAPAATPSGS